jgi:hypothetical protein
MARVKLGDLRWIIDYRNRRGTYPGKIDSPVYTYWGRTEPLTYFTDIMGRLTAVRAGRSHPLGRTGFTGPGPGARMPVRPTALFGRTLTKIGDHR